MYNAVPTPPEEATWDELTENAFIIYLHSLSKGTAIQMDTFMVDNLFFISTIKL